MTTLKLGECLYMSGCGRGEETPRVSSCCLGLLGVSVPTDLWYSHRINLAHKIAAARSLHSRAYAISSLGYGMTMRQNTSIKQALVINSYPKGVIQCHSN